jgi:hypothetical protein
VRDPVRAAPAPVPSAQLDAAGCALGLVRYQCHGIIHRESQYNRIYPFRIPATGERP